jgi:transcription elongation GreA/GreB family factor
VKHKAILMNVKDNVATALTDLAEGETIHVELDSVSVEVTLRQPVEFAHKLALRDIAQGEEVTKYGMPIGKALVPIRAGEWVHVHNCRSHRWGFHNETYGLQA